MFGYGLDRKTIYTILIVLVIVSLFSMSRAEWLNILLTLPAVIIAITFHEFAHAWMADKLGDTTPRNQGRLTLNPLSHLDPFGFVLLMFAHVGWGKPVQINPNNFTSNKSRGTCEMLVSFAGPAMNFIISIVLMIIYVILEKTASLAFATSYVGIIIVTLLYLTIIINIGLGVFNLIPLPPLDGEKIFRNILPYNAQSWLDRNSQTLYIIFMVLWITGFLGTLVSPIIGVVQKGLYFIVTNLVGFII